MDSKEPEERSLVKNKHRTLNGGQKKIVFVGEKEKDARKNFQKAMKAFRKVGFALANQKRVQSMISTRTKAEERTKQERERKVLILNLDFQPLKHQGEEGYGHAWESDDRPSSHWPDDSST